MNTQLPRTNTVHNYCKPLTSQDHLFVNHNDGILVLFPHMNWPIADENGPMLCQIEIPQSSNYGGGRMGTSFRRNDFWDRLAGHL